MIGESISTSTRTLFVLGYLLNWKPDISFLIVAFCGLDNLRIRIRLPPGTIILPLPQRMELLWATEASSLMVSGD